MKNPESSTSSGQAQELPDESKRITKLVRTVSLAVIATSLALFVSVSKPINQNLSIFYIAHLVFDYLSFSMGVGLLTYSIVKSSTDRRTTKVQKRTMILSITFILISFVTGTSCVLSWNSLEYLLLFFALGGSCVLLFLFVSWIRDGSDNLQASNTREVGLILKERPLDV